MKEKNKQKYGVNLDGERIDMKVNEKIKGGKTDRIVLESNKRCSPAPELNFMLLLCQFLTKQHATQHKQTTGKL